MVGMEAESVYEQYVRKFEWGGVPIVPAMPPNHPSKLTIMNTGVVVWTKEARLRARELFDDWQWWFFEGTRAHVNHERSTVYLRSVS